MAAGDDTTDPGPPEGGFGPLLRRHRQDRALTQEELAEAAAISPKAVGALERGERRRPYPHTVRALARALELDDTATAVLAAAGAGRPVEPEPAPTTPTVADPPLAGPALVGREEEVARLTTLVEDPDVRLVTVTGPGGVGKTRLAREVAARSARAFTGGAVVVELAPVRDPGLVLARVAGAVQAPDPGTGGAPALAASLAGRPLLVVLDNLEQVLGCAADLADLAGRCPDLTLLATSRAPLRIRLEREVSLGPLDVPAAEDRDADSVADSPAVQVFLDRCVAAGVALEVTDVSAPTIATICRRLDGLPLALELAAAGTRLLSVVDVLARLDAVLDRPGPRDLPERQRTMRAALDWSVELCAPAEQVAFARLAVFAGGATLPAVEAVAGDDLDPIDALAGLVEQSLVVRTSGPRGTTRVRLLEPVRQYAWERLDPGEAEDLADRHAGHFASVATAATGRLRSAEVVAGLDDLAVDHANLRAAVLRLVATDRGGEAARAVHGTWLYLAVRGHAHEGLDWTSRIARLAMSDAHRAALLVARAGLHYVLGDIVAMLADARTALDRARVAGRDELAMEAAILATSASGFSGDPAGGRDLLDVAWSTARALDLPWGRVHAMVAECQLALVTGDLAAADRWTRDALALARELDDAFTLATSLNLRATLTAATGDLDTSAVLLAESTRRSLDGQLGWSLGYSLPGLAGVAATLGHHELAATLYGAAATVSSTAAVRPSFPTSQDQSDRGLATVRDQLDPVAFRSAWDAGRVATPARIAALVGRLSPAGAA